MHWLGFDWGEDLFHASDYFEQLYAWAEDLIRAGKAYVDDQTPGGDAADARHVDRAGPRQPVSRPQRRGKPRSVPPHARGRIPERRARAARQDRHGVRQHQFARPGALPHPACRPSAHRQAWSIYPSYDFAHGQSDAIEGVTHSLCTLEFEDHRPLYDWFLDNLPVPSQPQQYEFARLNMTHTVLSKRVLTELVEAATSRLGRSAHADPRGPAPPRRAGGRDPRLRQARRRGACRQRRRSRRCSSSPMREELNKTAQRRMAVLRPLKVVIENYPEEDRKSSRRSTTPRTPKPVHAAIRFGRELYVERDDFMENPPKGFFRLSPGARCGCATPISSPAGRRRRTPPAKWSSCAAPTIPPLKAAMRRTAARSRRLCIGCRPRMLLPPRCGCTTRCSRARSDRRKFRRRSQPQFARSPPRCAGRTGAGRSECRRPGPVRAAGLFLPRSDSTPDRLVFNRTAGLRDTWAKVAASTG